MHSRFDLSLSRRSDRLGPLRLGPGAQARSGALAGGLVTLAVLAATLSPTTWAQEPSSDDAFGEVIDVRVINLDVVVTDRSGERVPGLTPEDFRLRVDGEDWPIDYFTEVWDGRAHEVEAGTLGAPSLVPGEPVPTSYLVFLDVFFGWAPDQSRMVSAVVSQLDRLGPQDRMALVSYDGSRVQEISGWTGSRRALEEAVQRIQWPRKAGASPFLLTSDYDNSENLRAAYEAEGVGPEGEPIQPFVDPPELQMYKKKLDRNLDRVTRAATATMQGYAQTPGRKVMLLMTGGWPFNSVEFFEPPEFGQPPNNSQALESLQRVADTANLLGYTLYAVDMPRDRYRDLGNNGEARELLHHASLDHLAKATGGQAYKNLTGLDAFASAVDDTRNYYWMGFTAPGAGDGKRHRVKLEVLRPGLEVRSRRGFVDTTREDQVTELVESAALVGQLAGAQPIDLSFGQSKRRGRREQIPVTLAVPLDGITMLPGAEGHTARLELRISAIDENGYLNDVPVIPWTFSGPEPQPGQVVYYETALKLRRLQHRVVVALYDLNSGTILMGEESLDL